MRVGLSSREEPSTEKLNVFWLHVYAAAEVEVDVVDAVVMHNTKIDMTRFRICAGVVEVVELYSKAHLLQRGAYKASSSPHLKGLSDTDARK